MEITQTTQPATVTHLFGIPITPAPAVVEIPAVTRFQVGSTYSMRSPGQHDCVWTFEVTKRTAQFVTLLDVTMGETHRAKVTEVPATRWDRDVDAVHRSTVETCMPFGRFSLAPVLSADAAA